MATISFKEHNNRVSYYKKHIIKKIKKALKNNGLDVTDLNVALIVELAIKRIEQGKKPKFNKIAIKLILMGL